MNFQQDWIMRQIDLLVQSIARVVFKKDFIKYEMFEEANLSQTDLLYRDLERLVAERKICEAENLLYDALDTDDMKHLELAIDFYQSINRLSDEELESCNFSREEVREGINNVMKLFGVNTLII